MRFRLIVLTLLLLSWASPVAAKLSLGVVPAANKLFCSMSQAQRFAAYLEKRLGEEVTVREFQGAAELHEWLNRFRMVDLAVFTVDYVRHQSIGEFDFLATAVPDGGDASKASELVVARQGVRRGLRNRLEVVLTAMEGDPEGAQLLAEVGISRLVGAKISMPVDLSPVSVIAAPLRSPPGPSETSGVKVLAKVVSLRKQPSLTAETPLDLAESPVPAAQEGSKAVESSGGGLGDLDSQPGASVGPIGVGGVV